MKKKLPKGIKVKLISKPAAKKGKDTFYIDFEFDKRIWEPAGVNMRSLHKGWVRFRTKGASSK